MKDDRIVINEALWAEARSFSAESAVAKQAIALRTSPFSLSELRRSGSPRSLAKEDEDITHHYWFFFTAFVGLNLIQSAFTHFCPAEMLLRKAGLK